MLRNRYGTLGCQYRNSAQCNNATHVCAMQYTSGIGISHLQHMRNALYGEVDEGFLAEFGEVGVERIEFGDIGWTDNKGSETATEGYSMAES